MDKKLTYEELDQRVRELEKEAFLLKKAKAEHEKKEGELRKYAAYIDAMSDALIVLNRERKVVKLNKTAMDLLGYQEEEIPELSFETIFPEKEHEKHYDEMSKAIYSGGFRPFETLVRKKDGKAVPVLFSGSLLKGDGSDITGFVGVCRDITDYKQMEDEFRDSENTYRTLLENLPQKIFLKDRDLAYVYCNENLAKDYNIRPEEIMGKTVYDFFPKELADKYRADDERIITSGMEGNIEEEYIRDGQERWIQILKTPVKDKDGNITGLLGVHWEITERKKLEEERTRLIAKLQKMNRELKDSNQQLEKATAQLIQSEKLSAIGELTAGVAHELNQPLNGIKIICQSILRDMEKNRFEEEEVGNDLTEIVIQVNKMAEIIDHMRVYTRHTEGTTRDMIDVNTVIEGPFKLLDQQLKTHNIEVIRELTPDLPNVMGDPIRLEQVFMNLISNAKNALESCGREDKRLEIRTYKMNHQSSAPDNSAVVVEVKDNGEGVPEHLREKIFQPFFTTREPGKGTGLGLSVSSKIIEEHGGRIEVESKAGEGTTFRVVLPISNEEDVRSSSLIT